MYTCKLNALLDWGRILINWKLEARDLGGAGGPCVAFSFFFHLQQKTADCRCELGTEQCWSDSTSLQSLQFTNPSFFLGGGGVKNWTPV